MAQTLMSYELLLSFRYLKAKRKQVFISVITFLSISGVTVGVMALIIVISVMNGFTEDLKSKILGTTSHVVLFARGGEMSDYQKIRKKILAMDGIKGASPFIYREVMLRAGRNVTGVILRGIDPETADSVISIEKALVAGKLEALGKEEGGLPTIFLGKELAGQIGVFKGEELILISPLGTLTPWGMQPKWKKFRVAGIFDTGYYDYDTKLAYISLRSAQDFLGLSDVATGIEIKVVDIYQARVIGQDVQTRLGHSFWASDWMQMNRNLLFALKLEKRVMFIILTCIILVAGLSIVSTLVMVVMEKTKDIAILKSMGAKARSIMRIFVIEGLIIGGMGTSLGCVLGLLIAMNLERIVAWIEKMAGIQFLPGDVYYISELPSKVNPVDLVVIIVVTIGISFLATLYPSWQAARLEPSEGLRYE
jgi:lipoprotein-releasing system permease protein